MDDTGNSLCFHLCCPISDLNIKARDGTSANFPPVTREPDRAYSSAPTRLFRLARLDGGVREQALMDHFCPEGQHPDPGPAPALMKASTCR